MNMKRLTIQMYIPVSYTHLDVYKRQLTRQAHKELRAFAEKKMEPEAVEDMFLFEDRVLNTGSIRCV